MIEYILSTCKDHKFVHIFNMPYLQKESCFKQEWEKCHRRLEVDHIGSFTFSRTFDSMFVLLNVS